MKNLFLKIVSLSMAFVVLFSTMSFTINMHYCGDTLVETAMFQEAKGCGMEMKQPETKDCEITKKNCCDNQQIIVDGQDELQLQINNLSFEKQLFISAFIFTYHTRFDKFNDTSTSFEKQTPPLVKRYLFKLNQTYLI